MNSRNLSSRRQQPITQRLPTPRETTHEHSVGKEMWSHQGLGGGARPDPAVPFPHGGTHSPPAPGLGHPTADRADGRRGRSCAVGRRWGPSPGQPAVPEGCGCRRRWGPWREAPEVPFIGLVPICPFLPFLGHTSPILLSGDFIKDPGGDGSPRHLYLGKDQRRHPGHHGNTYRPPRKEGGLRGKKTYSHILKADPRWKGSLKPKWVKAYGPWVQLPLDGGSWTQWVPQTQVNKSPNPAEICENEIR